MVTIRTPGGLYVTAETRRTTCITFFIPPNFYGWANLPLSGPGLASLYHSPPCGRDGRYSDSRCAQEPGASTATQPRQRGGRRLRGAGGSGLVALGVQTVLLVRPKDRRVLLRLRLAGRGHGTLGRGHRATRRGDGRVVVAPVVPAHTQWGCGANETRTPTTPLSSLEPRVGHRGDPQD